MPGGVFNQPVVAYSEGTKNFIKELIRESHVHSHYLRKVERSLHHAAPLPKATNQTPDDVAADISGPPHRLGTSWHSKRPKKEITKMVNESPDDNYIPIPPKYGPGSKERCQDLMANDGYAKLHKTNHINKRTVEDKQEEEIDRFDELRSEIRERVEWLQELEELGSADEYRNLVRSQIGIRIRDLEFMEGRRKAKDAAATLDPLSLKDTAPDAKVQFKIK